MRFPSLFRLPRHQQYQIKPRYYDPVKEEIDERTELIKKRMAEGDSEYEGGSSRISFKRKNKSTPSTSLIQLGTAVVLCLLIFGWLQFGNEVFQIYLFMLMGAYLIYRLRKGRKNR